MRLLRANASRKDFLLRQGELDMKTGFAISSVPMTRIAPVWHDSSLKPIVAVDCPLEVYEELASCRADHVALATNGSLIDWEAIVWREVQLSGAQLRDVAVPRAFQYAV